MRKFWFVILTAVMLMAAGCAKPAQPATPAEPLAQEPPAQTDTTQTGTEDENDTPEQNADDLTEKAEDTGDFLSGEWVQNAPADAQRVSVDADGEEIMLHTTRTLQKVWVSRVEYDEQLRDYVRTARVWWMEQWDADTPLVLQIHAPVEQAELELSWEDEFGERARRLIVPVRIYQNGAAEESVQLLHYAVPIMAADITDKTPVHYELSGDGMKETVEFTQRAAEGAAAPVAVLRVKRSGVTMEQQMTLLDARCWVADLDENGEAELYVSGDTVSGDTLTYGWVLGEDALESVMFAEEICTQDANGSVATAGRITQIEDGIVTMEKSVAVLGGSYAGTARFYGRGGKFAPLDGVWTLTGGPALTLRQALEVSLADGSRQTLAAGTQLTLTATDVETMANFETANGVRGTLELARERGYSGWLVEGIRDTTVFE